MKLRQHVPPGLQTAAQFSTPQAESDLFLSTDTQGSYARNAEHSSRAGSLPPPGTSKAQKSPPQIALPQALIHHGAVSLPASS
ncbi:hypothetical protein A9D60_10055 [Leisingera sp. JC1]|nr:hypothetical protein A9D60_10055 [Leisingera sp. JC1]